MSVLINSYEKPLLRIVFHNRNLFTDMALKRYPRHNRPLVKNLGKYVPFTDLT
jgi:hypothetical protein